MLSPEMTFAPFNWAEAGAARPHTRMVTNSQ